MGKKNKNKKKEVNAKKVRYTKFRKEKSAELDLKMPELSDDEIKFRRMDDTEVDKFFRFNRNPNTRSVNPRKDKSKR